MYIKYNMNIRIIHYELNIYKPKLSLQNGAEDINHVRFPDMNLNESSTESKDTLYICCEEDLKGKKLPEGMVNLVLFGSNELPEEDANRCNVIFIKVDEKKDRKDFALELFNRISVILQDNERYNKCADIIFRSNLLLSKKKYHIDEVADVIYEILGNPFSLCNREGVFLTSRYLFDIDAKFTEALKSIKSFPLPSTFEQVNSVVNVSEEPVIFEDFLGYPIRNVVGKVQIDGQEVAYMLMVEHNRRITELDIVLMKMICCWFSYEFRKDINFLYPEKAGRVRTLMQLIKDDISDYTGKTASEAGMGNGKYNFIFAVEFQNMNQEISSPHALAATMEELVEGSVSLLLDEDIILFVNTNDMGYVYPERKERMEEFAEKYHVKIGLSTSFTRMEHTRIAFDQALGAIRSGSSLGSKKRVFDYTNHAILHFIYNANKRNEVSAFCHPKLLELLKYDETHDTEYVYTTYMLLMSGGKQVEAAKRLNIHRSTMLYRMEKITEITGGLDLYNTYVVTLLYLSYEILIFEGILDPEIYQ